MRETRRNPSNVRRRHQISFHWACWVVTPGRFWDSLVPNVMDAMRASWQIGARTREHARGRSTNHRIGRGEGRIHGTRYPGHRNFPQPSHSYGTRVSAALGDRPTGLRHGRPWDAKGFTRHHRKGGNQSVLQWASVIRDFVTRRVDSSEPRTLFPHAFTHKCNIR